MPRISDERIDDFIARWQNSFGETLTREQAHPIAHRLVEMYYQMLKGMQRTEAERKKYETSEDPLDTA